MWDFKTSTHNHNWTPGSLGAGYIYAPGNFGGDYTVFDYSIRTWNIGPDHTDDIEREYRRHLPIHPMVFRFYIDPSGGVHDGGKGYHNLTGKSVDNIIDYLRRHDNRLHDGREEIKTERVSALDELKSVLSSFKPKIAHDLSWVKGNKGKGILLPDGKMVTWTVNKKRKPNHLTMYEYLTGQKLPKDFALSFMDGFPFDINESGQVSFLKETPNEIVSDVHKIDYRLKTSSVIKVADKPQGEYYHAAPASEREAIQEIGLVSGKPRSSGNWPNLNDSITKDHQLGDQPMGVYVSRHPEAARAFTKNFRSNHPLNQPMDIWRIPPGQIQEIWQDPMGSEGVEFFVPHDISDVELYEPHEGFTATANSPIMQAPSQGFAYNDKGIMVPQDGGFYPDIGYHAPQVDTGEPIAAPVDMNSQEKLMQEIDINLENLSPDELKTAISNALRAAIVSPQKSLFLNALDYQAFLDIPYNESDPDVYRKVYAEKRNQYNNLPDEEKVIIKDKPVDKMSNCFSERNWEELGAIGRNIEGAYQAAITDLEEGDGKGHHFRNWAVHALGGVGEKVASFAWLLFNPTGSDLATIDVHMIRALAPESEKTDSSLAGELQTMKYFMYEKILRARAMKLGFPEEATTAAIQWYLWDRARVTRPDIEFDPDYDPEQSHLFLRALDPARPQDVEFKSRAKPKDAIGLKTDPKYGPNPFVPNWDESYEAVVDPAMEQHEQQLDQILEAYKSQGYLDLPEVQEYIRKRNEEDPNLKLPMNPKSLYNQKTELVYMLQQLNPALMQDVLTRQASAKKEFTKEDAFDLLEKNGWDFDGNEFWMGMNDELEHDWLTHGDPETTAKIVIDHLSEHPDYYSKLHKTFKTAALNEYVEMVPTEVLAKYAEYNEPISEEHLASLEEDIKTNGIQEPVVIDYDQDTGQAHISEGNHRILAAQNLGIESVPAFVYRSSRKGQRSMPADLVKEDSWADPFDPSGFRVPQYMKPSQIKIARPADPEWWGGQAQQHDYLYHATERASLPSIAQSGLMPSDQQLSTDRGWEPRLTPRPGHIYFGLTEESLNEAGIWSLSEPVTLRVRRDYLNPQLINPDEDVIAKQYNEEIAIGGDHMWDEETDELLSRGQYAEMEDYGKYYEDTQGGIEKSNTLAYNGSIPPEAIEYEADEGQWQPITNLLQQQLTAKAKAAAWDKPINKLSSMEQIYVLG